MSRLCGSARAALLPAGKPFGGLRGRRLARRLWLGPALTTPNMLQPTSRGSRRPWIRHDDDRGTGHRPHRLASRAPAHRAPALPRALLAWEPRSAHGRGGRPRGPNPHPTLSAELPRSAVCHSRPLPCPEQPQRDGQGPFGCGHRPGERTKEGTTSCRATACGRRFASSRPSAQRRSSRPPTRRRGSRPCPRVRQVPAHPSWSSGARP